MRKSLETVWELRRRPDNEMLTSENKASFPVNFSPLCPGIIQLSGGLWTTVTTLLLYF